MELVRSRGVAIDACPASNAITGAVRHVGVHPLNEFLNEGLLVTLSSDDPAFFGVTLLDEYESLATQGFSHELLAQLARNGFAASFASEQQKFAWLAELQDYTRAQKRATASTLRDSTIKKNPGT
jgi:adenosine deaminase